MYASEPRPTPSALENGVFDASFLGGSLHIFPDTSAILNEVGRVLKPKARVVVTTVIHGEKGINRKAASRPHLKIFDIPELEKTVNAAGFENFDPQPFGCLLPFTTEKGLLEKVMLFGGSKCESITSVIAHRLVLFVDGKENQYEESNCWNDHIFGRLCQ